jgi:Xaa-Pro aminopeptidase
MMRLFAFFCLFSCVLPAAIPLGEYQQRRALLRKELQGKTVLLAGATENERGNLRSGFLQEPNFLYLSGWREPGAFVLMAGDGEEILFLPKRSEIRERYTGRKLAAGDADATQITGFAKVLEESELEAQLKRFTSKVHTITRGEPFERLQTTLGAREWVDISRDIARLRMVKSPSEIALIREATLQSIAAHKAAFARIQPGLFEYQLAAAMSALYLDRGCERNAYPPIIASGPNSVILHYWANRRRMDSGELVVMDVGAECADYAADLTRTVPVTGRFTPRQREIYQIVLDAQQAAIAAAKPGMKLLGLGPDSLNGVARAHVAKFNLEKYYLHAIGHHVGLEVHDPVDPDLVLQPGMIVTIEPGLYIAEENIGVRIEDMILITEKDGEVLSSTLPREIKDIERAAGSRRK